MFFCHFWLSHFDDYLQVSRKGVIQFFRFLREKDSSNISSACLSFAWCHITWLSLFNTRGIQNLGKQTIYGSAFGENIFLIRHSGGYWDTATEMKPLMHLWTLAVEEQYYIFYPLLCWILWKVKKRVLPVLCVLWLVSFGFDLYQSQTSSIVAFFSLHTRFWELCTGCILAALVNPSISSKGLVQPIASKLREERARELGG